jgi:hypothetical protein
MGKRILAVALMVAGLAPAAVSHGENQLLCPQWQRAAMKVGFTSRQYKTLDYIIWRESRCNPKAVNNNVNRYGSVWSRDWGLTQVNDYSWITFLRNRKIVTKSTELLSPLANLEAAKALVDYSESHHDDPWLQWRK